MFLSLIVHCYNAAVGKTSGVLGVFQENFCYLNYGLEVRQGPL